MAVGTRSINLRNGELALADCPVVIHGELGGSVAVFIHCSGSRAGGAVRFDLESANRISKSGFNDSQRAMARLVSELSRISRRDPRSFRAKVIGGASGPGNKCGDANIEVAQKWLSRHGIPIVSQDVGDSHRRLFRFEPDSGRLQVKRLTMVETGEDPQMSVATPPSALDKPSAQKQIETTDREISVLIVDDSMTIREMIGHLIETTPGLSIFGKASHPLEAEKMMQSRMPDVITLDINMPQMDGITYLERYLPRRRIPVVMISSFGNDDGPYVLNALSLGAVDYIQKPSLKNSSDWGPMVVEKIRSAAFANVRLPLKRDPNLKFRKPISSGHLLDHNMLIVMGASTGGTEALANLLQELPDGMPPILIVQHIPPAFSSAFAERVNGLCPFEVKEACDRDEVKSGRVLIAPGGMHMRLSRLKDLLVVRLDDGPPINRHKPSVDALFHSVRENTDRPVVGVLLTGMGDDGAAGLKAIRDQGHHTIAQDENTCVVFGMPKAAIEKGAAVDVLPLEAIPGRLLECMTPRHRRF